MYVYVYVYTYVCVYAHMYVHICIHMYVYVCICMHACMSVYVCMYVCVYMYVCIYVCVYMYICGASLVAQTVKHLSPMLETRVRSLGWEDPLEKEMATHSSTLAWKTPWTEEPGRLQSMGSQRVGHD